MASYKKIAKLLQQHFNNGEYPEGKYPSLRKIAAEMGCCYTTAVHAMHYLQEQNAVHSKPVSFPIVAMVTGLWRFTPWHKAVRESVMELGGQVRFVTYSSYIDPVIAQTINGKYDLVILGCPVEKNSPLFKVIRKNKDHVILLADEEMSRFGIRCINGAPEETVITIMKDLAKQGIRQIDMIGRYVKDGPAIRQKVWEQGLDLIMGSGHFYGYPHVSFNQEAKETYDYIKDRIRKLPQAFFCQSPNCAQGLYHFLDERGLVPGKDISVFSFGDNEIAEMMNPPLATVLDAGMKEMIKSVISEYVTKQFSDTMLFKLTESRYEKGRSLKQ